MVFALTIQPERLVKLRQEELDWAELLLRRERWPVVDVTNKSIEESAAEILALQGRRIDRTPQRVKAGVGPDCEKEIE